MGSGLCMFVRQEDFECLELKLFGARCSKKMQKSIDITTKLFLYNVKSHKLLGPFIAAAPPSQSLHPVAFGGRFNSQVHVKSVSGAPLMETTHLEKLKAGPKTLEEVAALLAMLK